MSNAAELAAGFRRLRPAVHEWLTRDLADGPGGAQTRAYADLLFAHAFARLGAADDARRLTAEAGAALAAGGPPGEDYEARVAALVAGSLSAMFRYRIDEALTGRPPRPTLPLDLLIAVPVADPPHSPLRTARYPVERARALLRVLEPGPHVDGYGTQNPRYSGGWLRRRAGELVCYPDGADLEERLAEFLAAADREPAGERGELWAMVLPLAALAGEGFRTGLLLRVPGVVADVLPALAPDPEHPDAHLRPARGLVSQALRQAAAMPDGEFFPPLVDAALAVVAAASIPARVAADLGWDGLCWFRRLGAAEEAEAFLYRTRDVWPAGTPVEPPDAVAVAIHAGLLNVAGRGAEAAARLDAVAAVLPRVGGPGGSKDTVDAATAYARAASTDRAGVDRLLGLFPLLGPVTNTWTTAQYYSRFHLEVVDAMLLAFPAVRGT